MKLLFLTLMSIMALGLSVYSGGENKVRAQYIFLGINPDGILSPDLMWDPYFWHFFSYSTEYFLCRQVRFKILERLYPVKAFRDFCLLFKLVWIRKYFWFSSRSGWSGNIIWAQLCLSPNLPGGDHKFLSISIQRGRLAERQDIGVDDTCEFPDKINCFKHGCQWRRLRNGGICGPKKMMAMRRNRDRD